MAMDTAQIGKRAWSYATVLQQAGLSCVEYVEQLTMLLFLKMADQLTEEPYNQAPIVPADLGWKSLLPLDGAALEEHYTKAIEKLALKPGSQPRHAQCAMNLYLHGIGGDKVVVHSGHDSLAAPWSKEYSMILANPPFGRGQSVEFVNVKINGRAAVVLPDNVLFEGGAGEKVRRNLLEKCNVHTLLRLPTGIWYAPGVKANVLFFDKKEGRPKPWTERLWVYDLPTNKHFTQKQSPITRKDFDEFVACFKPGAIHKRKATCSEEKPDGRWRSYSYDDIVKRDKLSMDLFWLKDQSLTDTDSLPAPEIIATEIADELEAALGEGKVRPYF